MALSTLLHNFLTCVILRTTRCRSVPPRDGRWPGGDKTWPLGSHTEVPVCDAGSCVISLFPSGNSSVPQGLGCSGVVEHRLGAVGSSPSLPPPLRDHVFLSEVLVTPTPATSGEQESKGIQEVPVSRVPVLGHVVLGRGRKVPQHPLLPFGPVSASAVWEC